MITIVCHACHVAVRTVGEPNELELLTGPSNDWWPNKYPCPRCRGMAAVAYAISPEALSTLEVHDLTVAEAFSAFGGMGFPEERECGPLAVRVAFQAPVKTVNARLIRGTNRSIIDSIEFIDGTMMYLGSSPYGAIIYRIAAGAQSAD